MTTPKKADHLQPPPLIDDQAIEIHIITKCFYTAGSSVLQEIYMRPTNDFKINCILQDE